MVNQCWSLVSAQWLEEGCGKPVLEFAVSPVALSAILAAGPSMSGSPMYQRP